MISKNLRRVAADSNVLLSAVIGKAALKILIHPEIEVLTTQFNLKEVEKYIPHLASKYQLDDKTLLLQLKMLPIVSFSEKDYRSQMPRAREFLEARDPDDTHLAALAFKEDVCIWSNDKDFENLPISVYPTAKLLKMLES